MVEDCEVVIPCEPWYKGKEGAMERVGEPVYRSQAPFCALIEHKVGWVNTR
jgi:hypothetical protein